MTVLDYGTGRTRRRRPSFLAVFALLMPCLLWLLAVITVLIYLDPPAPGWDRLPWLMGVGALSGIVLIATYLVAPVSIACGLTALSIMRREPGRLYGRRSAIAGMVLSALLLISVAVAHYKVAKSFSRLGTTAPLPPPDPAASEKEDMRELLLVASMYANQHDGIYAADAGSIHSWALEQSRTPRPIVQRLGQYLYCGDGLRDGRMLSADPREINDDHALIVWVQRKRLPDGSWIVGVKADEPNDGILVVPASQTAVTFDRCNRFRAMLGLAHIDFDQLELTPATQPSASISGSPKVLSVRF